MQDLKREREQLKKNIEREKIKVAFWLAQVDEIKAKYDTAVEINKDLREENNKLRDLLRNADRFAPQTGFDVLFKDGSSIFMGFDKTHEGTAMFFNVHDASGRVIALFRKEGVLEIDED